MNTLYKLTRSSVDPEKMSATVRSILFSIVPLVIVFSGMTEAELQPFIDVIVNITFFATSLFAALGTLFGLLRKFANGRWTAAE